LILTTLIILGGVVIIEVTVEVHRLTGPTGEGREGHRDWTEVIVDHVGVRSVFVHETSILEFGVKGQGQRATFRIG
jgi:hypothetical protein